MGYLTQFQVLQVYFFQELQKKTLLHEDNETLMSKSEVLDSADLRDQSAYSVLSDLSKKGSCVSL